MYNIITRGQESSLRVNKLLKMQQELEPYYKTTNSSTDQLHPMMLKPES